MSAFLRPSPQITKSVPYPAPILGINAVDGLSDMDPRDAIFCYNMYPSKYGLRVRKGYVEWATNVGTNGGGRTVMAYKGSTAANDRLFATSQEGIFNVSASGSSFSTVVVFGTTTGNAGYGQYLGFVTSAGHFLLYFDEVNGYYTYTESTTTWAAVPGGSMTGIAPGDIVGGCTHKGRLWFVKRNSASAYYLSAGTITGAVTEFNFGTRFKNGGYLVNLYSWTVDGGEGMDDHLVAVSSSGDVVIFKGNDPSSATDWFQHGAWFIGRPPAGRRVAGALGRELYLLSSYGVLPLSALIAGGAVEDDSIYLTRRITDPIRTHMASTLDNLGWELQLIPDANLLLVSAPQVSGEQQIQFIQEMNKRAWGVFRGFPYYTGKEWNGEFYFSNAAGKVYVMTGNLDNVNLAGSSYEQIEFSLLTSYQELEADGFSKRTHFIRPVFTGGGVPGYEVSAQYDYKLFEGNPTIGLGTISGATWDSAIWDDDLWAGGAVVTDKVVGGDGMGRAIAIALKGKSAAETTLIKFDVMADVGGML